MAYSGKYTVKNPKKYQGDYTKVIYRSMWEKWCFKWCDENSEIKTWSSEEVVVPYFYDVDKKYHRYFVDLKVTYKSGKTVLIEIKPDKETKAPAYPGKKTRRYINEGLTYVKNLNKWKAAQRFAKDRNWEFVIWTENTLESMGIKPKSTKPLKPYKRKKKVKK
tara:strand:- start:1397 stop:1885 length:489 start_codon:yes stop_codon:yes gene_type:complete